jgi:CRISPR-associated endonuclease/helicase Cas3
MAESFSAPFGPGWGRLVGLWHDVGKYQSAFQQRLFQDPEAHVTQRVDHSSVGALVAKERGAAMASFVIAGHHGGLPNGDDLRNRLHEKQHLLEVTRREGMPTEIEDQAVPVWPSWLAKGQDLAAMALWTRFLFSALVDADFLGTERFYAGDVERQLGSRAGLRELKARLDAYIATKTAGAERTSVNDLRARVLAAARESATLDAGAFSLTVPTGGGKTLTSLVFALDHAVRHDLKRVIVVIPYTSIIEQTAKTYREALGEDAVVEHHTNVDPDIETRTNRLASENWDAPVVVTTSVQFFESLYANRTSRCRKLHRIARSVVVFDEVQTFPVGLLAPVKHVLGELRAHYGVTTVFCTATQPTLMAETREIVPHPEHEFAVVAGRCEIRMPKSEEPVTWDSLANQLRGHEQVMAIVNRRDDAQQLADLTGEDCLHLSARMCAAHRSAVLEEVKERLRAGAPCRLVATQLVEAGVDIDFPEVYRAFAGADSLAQAAGRCNREGKGMGRLHVFIAPTQPPRGILRTANELAKTMWKEGKLHLQNVATFREYFRRLYELSDQDKAGVMAAERSFRFEDVARLFRMIEDAGEPVVAPYGDWAGRVDEIRQHGVSRDRMRRLQPFMVSLYRQEVEKLQAAGALERVAESFWATVPGFRPYSQRWGFGWHGPVPLEPEDLIA